MIQYLNANKEWLSVLASLIQCAFALLAIPAAIFAANYGARKGAAEAFKLTEFNDNRAKQEQIHATRQLISLEIERNLKAVQNFSHDFEREAESAPEAEPLLQQFIVSYAPDLSFRSWQGLQLSPLLPLAFQGQTEELQNVDEFYARLERVVRIQDTLTKLGRQADHTTEQRRRLIEELKSTLQLLCLEENPVSVSQCHKLTGNHAMKKLQIIVACADGAPEYQAQVEEVIEEVNVQATSQGRDVQIELRSWHREATFPFFYKESPRLLLAEVLQDAPDCFIGIFATQFGGRTDPEHKRSTRSSQFKELVNHAAKGDAVGDNCTKTLIYLRDTGRIIDPAVLRFRADCADQMEKLWFSFKREDQLLASIKKALHDLIDERAPLPFNKHTPAITLPDGWKFVDADFLEKWQTALGADGKLSPRDAASYFDGILPQWKHTLSKSVPPRQLVATLEQEIGDKDAYEGRTRVTLLVGPGGEGKSTILQQVAARLGEKHPVMHVLWHESKRVPQQLSRSLVEDMLESEDFFLIVSDDAEKIHEDVWDAVLHLQGAHRPNVQFLLAARRLDWEYVGADTHDWQGELGDDYCEVPVRDLSIEDAQIIVSAWEEAGAPGLGEFAKVASDQRAQELLKLSRNQTLNGNEQGSFLGAMLEARKRQGLSVHVRSIVQSLKNRDAPPALGCKRLHEVFGDIVALHADNQLLLEEKVLRRVLRCNERELNEYVIHPLADGDEAAIEASVFILARHRRIAEEARNILAKEEHMDFQNRIIPNLLRAAMELSCFRPAADVLSEDQLDGDSLSPWNRLPIHYMNMGQHVLAIELAKVLVETDPGDPVPVATLAKVHRESTDSAHRSQAATLMRGNYDAISANVDRGFMTEWAAAEGSENAGRNDCFDVWLCAIILSDEMPEKRLGDAPRLQILAGITSAFKRLHNKANSTESPYFNKSNAQVFLQACAAASQLGLDKRTQRELPAGYDQARSWKQLSEGKILVEGYRIEDATNEEALAKLLAGIQLACQLQEAGSAELPSAQIPKKLVKYLELRFDKLYKLFDVEWKNIH